jgi:hypothetical protein
MNHVLAIVLQVGTDVDLGTKTHCSRRDQTLYKKALCRRGDVKREMQKKE